RRVPHLPPVDSLSRAGGPVCFRALRLCAGESVEHANRAALVPGGGPRMNLLHVVPYYAPAWRYGGAVRAVTDLTRAQAAAGHRVCVLTTDALGPGQRVDALTETIDGVAVTRVRNRSAARRDRLTLAPPAGIAAAAERLIRDHAIDAVHCHELRTVENLRVAAVANRLGVPLLVSPHGTLPLDTGRGS